MIFYFILFGRFYPNNKTALITDLTMRYGGSNLDRADYENIVRIGLNQEVLRRDRNRLQIIKTPSCRDRLSFDTAIRRL